jgi:hypothetical protein
MQLAHWLACVDGHVSYSKSALNLSHETSKVYAFIKFAIVDL